MWSGVVSLEEVRVRLALFMDLHLHFERVELLLDLLRQDRSQSVASRNVAATVVVRSAPCVVELYARREGNAFAAGRCCWHAPSVGHGRDTRLTEVIVVGVVTEGSASGRALLWCARHGGCWAVEDVRHTVGGLDIRRICR